MTAAPCAECGAENPTAPLSGGTIIHKPGCSVGIQRQRIAELARLGRMAKARDEAESVVEELRDLITRQVGAVDELGVPRSTIAEAARLSRGRLYQEPFNLAR